METTMTTETTALEAETSPFKAVPLWRPVIYEAGYGPEFWSEIVLRDGLYLRRHFLRCAALAFNNRAALNAAWDLPKADLVESEFGEMIAPPLDEEAFFESLGAWGDIDADVFFAFHDAYCQGLTEPPP
jgi:hypothetical protein